MSVATQQPAFLLFNLMLAKAYYRKPDGSAY